MLSRVMMGLIGAGSMFAVCVALSLHYDLEERRETAGESATAGATREAYVTNLTKQVAKRDRVVERGNALPWDMTPQAESPRSQAVEIAESPHAPIRWSVPADEAFFRSADAEPLPIEIIEIVEGLDPEDVADLFRQP